MTTLFSTLTSPTHFRFWRRNGLQHGLMLGCVLAGSLFTASAVRAAGVVSEPTEAALDAALQGGGTVTFACDGNIPITTTKNIAADTVIDATGHNITLDAGAQCRIFTVTGTARTVVYSSSGIFDGPGLRFRWVASYRALTLRHLTLTRGFATNGGAASLAVANVNIANCAFLNNAAGSGGAVYAASTTFSGSLAPAATFINTVTITNSVFAGNVADSDGGAIATPANTLSLTRCAFLNNRAGGSAVGRGGGVYAPNGARLDTCTLTGNRAYSGNGGGLYAEGTVSLTNCTVARNSLSTGGNSGLSGGGLASASGTCTLTNTLLAENTVDGVTSNARGTLTDGGHNLCSDGSCAFTDATSMNNTEARLGAPIYTGDATPTLSLMAGSPAIDAGDDSKAPTTDQRGVVRQGAHSDIGAYERPLWQADGLAVGPDAKTRLLWNRNNAALQLWNVDTNTGNYTLFCQGGPFSVGTATNLTVGGDNATNLLWQNTNGTALLWRVNSQGGFLNEHGFGPNPGWTASSMAVGRDNKQRVLWNNLNGSTFFWNVNNASGNIDWGAYYDVITDWRATALAVGADGNLRVLWNKTDGQMFLWSVNTTTGQIVSGATFGPVPGWTATNIACGKDNNIRVLWQNVSGQVFLWSVDTNTQQIVSGCTFGPFAGASAAGISVGDDNNTRLLWNKTDGTAELWNVDTTNGNILSTQAFGSLN